MREAEAPLHRVDAGGLERVRHLFAPLAYHLVISAVIEGTSPGRVYADDPVRPASALVLTVEGNFLAGRPDNHAFNAAVARLLEETVFAGDTVRPGDNGFSVVFDSGSWLPALPAMLGGREPILSRRRHLACRRPPPAGRGLPEDFCLHRVDAGFLCRPGLGPAWAGHAPGWIEVNWGSVESFLTRSLGFCLLHGDAAVSWSIADCASGDRCEIGIRTHPAYRRQGLATLVVTGAVEWLLANGFSRVGWHCAAANPASWRLAEKAGFEHVCAYDSYYVLSDRLAHLAELGWVELSRNRPAGALERFEQAARLAAATGRGEPAWLAYLTAQALSGLGRGDEALLQLNAALDRGLAGPHRVLHEEAFRPLYGCAGWKRLVARLPAAE